MVIKFLYKFEENMLKPNQIRDNTPFKEELINHTILSYIACGDMKMVHYCCESPEMYVHPSKKILATSGLSSAALHGHQDIFDYLLKMLNPSELHDSYQHEIKNVFTPLIAASCNEHEHLVEHIINHPKIKPLLTHYAIVLSIGKSCNLKNIKSYFSMDKYPQITMSQWQEIAIDTFTEACKKGNIEVVKTLVNDDSLPSPLLFSIVKNNGLLIACWHGNCDMIKFLISSEELPEHAEIQYIDKNYLLMIWNRDKDFFKNLMNSPNGIEFDTGFELIVEQKDLQALADIVQNLTHTQIEKYMQSKCVQDNIEVNKVLESAMLYKQLHQEMEKKGISIKRRKI